MLQIYKTSLFFFFLFFFKLYNFLVCTVQFPLITVYIFIIIFRGLFICAFHSAEMFFTCPLSYFFFFPEELAVE